MNLAVLPIAKLGRADRRDIIEYYSTFTADQKQQEMVWTVRGAAGLGLPGELGVSQFGSQKTSSSAAV